MPRKSIKTETMKDLLKQIEKARAQNRQLRTKIKRYEGTRRGVNFIKLEDIITRFNYELINIELDIIRNDVKQT